MGGQISADGQTDNIIRCSEDNSPIVFSTTGTLAPGNYFYLLTSQDNEFLQSFAASTIVLSELPIGNYRIWGVHVLGDLNIRIGDDVTNSSLSDHCFDLSDNFVSVGKIQALGGIISTIDGDDIVYACPGQNNPKITEFETINTQGTGEIAYLLVDSTETVLQILNSPTIDLDTLAIGHYAVYSVTFNGDLLIGPGNTLSDDLASLCATLSQNKVDLVIETPVGGTISGNGITGNKICINNTETLLKLSASGQSLNTAYTFLITNDRDEFLFAVQDSVDLNVFFDGDLKVWGLAYTGNLTLQPLQDVKGVDLSDDCYEVSSNVLTIVKEDIDGGTIATLQGADAAFACPGDGNPDIVSFENTCTSGTANYAYIITTTVNNIRRTIDGNARDFDNLGAFRALRVWGVSYTGTLNTPIFAGLFETQLSDGCFDISKNFLPIFREAPRGASIRTEIGDQNISLCPGATSDTVQLSNTSTSLAGYAYLLVDNSNRTITQIITDGKLITRSVPLGNYQLFGLSYTGNITAQVGDPFSDLSEFTDNCHELSATPINVIRGGEVNGGVLSTPDDRFLYYTCPFDQQGDLIIVDAPEAIPGTDYRIVITDTNNSILFPDIQGGIIPFDGAMPGEYRIWGISFTGDYRGQFGLDVLSDPLSTECYTTSENFITVISVNPEAGQISTADGRDSLNLDADADPIVAFQNTAMDNAPYRYLLSDTAGTILQVSETDQLDFSGLSAGTYRVYGINFTGDFLAAPGDFITDNDLASNCYSLSENSVTIILENGAGLAEQSPILNRTPGNRNHADLDIQVYPNPVRDRIMVQFEWKVAQVETVNLRLIDQNGRIIQQQNISAQVGLNTHELNLSMLPEGLFMIQLQSADYQGKERFIKLR